MAYAVKAWIKDKTIAPIEDKYVKNGQLDYSWQNSEAAATIAEWSSEDRTDGGYETKLVKYDHEKFLADCAADEWCDPNDEWALSDWLHNNVL